MGKGMLIFHFKRRIEIKASCTSITKAKLDERRNKKMRVRKKANEYTVIIPVSLLSINYIFSISDAYMHIRFPVDRQFRIVCTSVYTNAVLLSFWLFLSLGEFNAHETNKTSRYRAASFSVHFHGEKACCLCSRNDNPSAFATILFTDYYVCNCAQSIAVATVAFYLYYKAI